MNEEEYSDRAAEWEVLERRYHWLVTTLVGVICLLAGMIIQSERNRDEVVRHSVQIEALEKRLSSIETKLDLVLREDAAK